MLGIAKNIFNSPTTRSFPNDLQLLPPSSTSKRQKTGNQHKDVASITAPPLESPVVNMSHPLIDNTTTTSTSSTAANGSLSLPPRMSDSNNCTRQEFLSSSLPSYWNSQDACNLFGIKFHAPLDNVRDMLMLQVELLQSVNKSKNGWRNAIEGRDPDNLCTPSKIFAICGRSMILCLAYKLAMLNMNKWTWLECCSEACSQLNPLGILQAAHKRTVCDWNNIFRRHGTFQHPNHSVRCGKRPLPLLLEKYPVAMDEIIQFGVKNLTMLTVESVRGFCHDVLIPKLFKQWKSDIEHSNRQNRDQDPLTKEMFLVEHKISMLSIPTCWQWMHRLGFTYNTQRKGYCVDGHERSDVVASRKVFCETYLTDIEPRCLRWIKVLQRELDTTHNVLNPEFGYRFVDEAAKSQVEFHVDYCTCHETKDKDLLVGKHPTICVRAPAASIDAH